MNTYLRRPRLRNPRLRRPRLRRPGLSINLPKPAHRPSIGARDGEWEHWERNT